MERTEVNDAISTVATCFSRTVPVFFIKGTKRAVSVIKMLHKKAKAFSVQVQTLSTGTC